MTKSRLFLVAPEAILPELLLDCSKAACAAIDCAFIIAPAITTPASVVALQNLGIAVLLRDATAAQVTGTKADGVHLSDATTAASMRKELDTLSIGVLAGTSRHFAMEAAEAGADYVAFTQTKQFTGEPLISWWQDVTDLPVAAFDPVDQNSLAILLPQKPDFIRPSVEMWQSPTAATRIISAISAALKA